MKKNVRNVRMAKGRGRNYPERDLDIPMEAPREAESHRL